MPHQAAEQDSSSRRSPLPGLGADLPGLRPDLPGLGAPMFGRHVPPLRGQDGHPLELYFSELDAGVQPDDFSPHSTTAVHKTTPALAWCAAYSSPLDARPAGLPHSRARTAVPASETDEQAFSSGLLGPQDGQSFENGMQEVCQTLSRPPPLHQQFMAEVIVLLDLQPTRLLQP